MTATFDTFDRNKLLDMYHKTSENDENGKIRKLFSSTKLSKKVNDYIGEEYFNTNIGSPQSDGISGINFETYFENALEEIRHKRQAFKLAQETSKILRDTTRPFESI